MAERLTDRNTVSIYNNSNSEIYLGKGEEATKYIYKLAQLEDIMDKYGIESFELLEHIIKKGMVINSVIEDFAKEEYDKMKQDRDTWKRACELACVFACSEVDCDNCPIYEKCKWCGDCVHNLFDYFYQKAKKEGENNDTNN